jgi:hypothetical protein
MASLTKENEQFRNVLEEHHFVPADMIKVLDSNLVLQEFGRMILRGRSDGETLDERLRYFFIHENSMLYKDCKKYYFIYCNKEDYIREKSNLQSEMGSYDEINRKLFLINFLDKFTDLELMEYSNFAMYCQIMSGEVDTIRYRNFFSEISSEIEKKYRNWINRAQIDQFFGKDERSVFWKNYQFVSVKKNTKHNMVILECMDFYITEFLGKANGAMYIFDKRTYRNTISYWLQKYSTSDLKSHLYNDEKLAIQRLTHSGEWQSRFKKCILQYHITDTVM